MTRAIIFHLAMCHAFYKIISRIASFTFCWPGLNLQTSKGKVNKKNKYLK